MDHFTTINTEIDTRGVVHLTLNRPEKKNALSAQMIAELTEFAQTIDRQKSARVVLLRGAGDVFCAG
ncbi:MAG: enoyl-CoA hydratase, partial [Marinovum sp.]|nr:enoyl-CoA hydratase [Marinovum sp.]